MEIRHPEDLSPEILVGIVNEKLRLNCKDKASLLYELDMAEAELDRKLADFSYDPISNQYHCR